MLNGAFLIFSIPPANITLMLLGAVTLSTLDRIVFVESKIAFLSLVPLFTETFLVQKSVGEIKCFSLSFITFVFVLDLF